MLKREKMEEDKSAFHSVAFSYDDDNESKYGEDSTTSTTTITSPTRTTSTTTITSPTRTISTTPSVASPSVETKPQSSDEKPAADVKPEDGPFVPPFTVPHGITLPTTIKTHKIIDQTAKFIASKGPTVVDALKKKQANNAHFSFLNTDDKLHPYYLFLLATAKGEPLVLPKAVLLAAKSEKAAVPTVKLENSSTHTPDTPVSPTIIKTEISPIKSDIASPTYKPTSTPTTPFFSPATSPPSTTQSYGPINIPPDDVKSVIDKLISFVEKNGKQFEKVVKEKEKNNEKFAFLYPWNQYHSYYKSKVDQALAAIATAKAKEEAEKTKEEAAKTKEEAEKTKAAAIQEERVQIKKEKEQEEEDAKPEMITEYEITATTPTVAVLKVEKAPSVSASSAGSPVVINSPPSILDNLSKKYADDEKEKRRLERLQKAKVLMEAMKTPEERAREEAEKQKAKDLEFVEKLRQQLQEKEEQKRKDKEYEEYLRSKDRSKEFSSRSRRSRRSKSRSRSRSRSRDRDRKSKRRRSKSRSRSRSRSRGRDRDKDRDRDRKSRRKSTSRSRSRSRPRSRSRSPSRRKSRR